MHYNTVVSPIQQKIYDFFAKYRQVSYQPGKTLIRSNEKIEYIYYIEEGDVRQYSISKGGDELTMHVFTKGAFMPIMLVLADMQNNYTFEAITPVTARVCPSKDVVDFLLSDTEVMFDLTRRFAIGISKLLIKTETTLYQDAHMRIVSILQYLAEKFGEQTGDKVKISLPLTHADIAAWVGLQRETTSRQLEQLRKKGVVELKNRELVVDLVSLANEKKDAARS